jgi:uncharacterized protein (TIGR02391 family)
MTRRLVDALRRLQEYIFEVGLARSVLALPAPRMLALPSSTGEDAVASNVFAITVTEPEIEAVSRDLFASGHYSLSIQEAYKALDKFIGEKAGESLSGTSLMDLVFSPKAPLLVWTDRKSKSEQDEQMGYHRLYSGAMLGIRNPVTHEFNWIEDQEIALELLVFAQHLLRKAKVARVEAEHLAGLLKK